LNKPEKEAEMAEKKIKHHVPYEDLRSGSTKPTNWERCAVWTGLAGRRISA